MQKKSFSFGNLLFSEIFRNLQGFFVATKQLVDRRVIDEEVFTLERNCASLVEDKSNTKELVDVIDTETLVSNELLVRLIDRPQTKISVNHLTQSIGRACEIKKPI